MHHFKKRLHLGSRDKDKQDRELPPDPEPEPEREPKPEPEAQSDSDTEDDPEGGEESQTKRSRVAAALKIGLARGKEEYLKGKLTLQKEVGLGKKPNVIPDGEADTSGDLRPVQIGWHPVAGLAGKWFAENYLGKKIASGVKHYPDPTQHWAVLVGDYAHQLWMDEHLDVIYTNEKVNLEEWRMFEVGKTNCNDQAIKQRSEEAIEDMRKIKPGYNLINHNCQNFVVFLLQKIQVGSQKEFGTVSAVVQRTFGKGHVVDLFVDENSTEQQVPQEQQVLQEGQDQPRPQLHHQDTVQVAQQVMEQHTTKLDNHMAHC